MYVGHGGISSSSSSSSSSAYGPYTLTNAAFRMIAQTDLSSTFFLHLLTPIDFRSFSIEFNHLNFGFVEVWVHIFLTSAL
jgi:hypothetical protein